MKKIEVITNQINEKYVMDKYILFQYRCLDRKLEKGKIYLTFEEDDSLPYYQDLKRLEKEYGDYKIFPLFPILLFPVTAFILLTIFLIIYFVNKDTISYVTLFLSLMLPALIILLVGAALFGIHLIHISKIEKEKPEKDELYRKRIEELKKKNNPQKQ